MADFIWPKGGVSVHFNSLILASSSHAYHTGGGVCSKAFKVDEKIDERIKTRPEATNWSKINIEGKKENQ